MEISSKERLIAYYLPQFHPISENDEWWGKGFTEWTNTAKAKPLFRGHYQPHIPADLGFYDLRLPEARIAQAEMAKEYGVDAFCYYHYWFAGKNLLEKPFEDVLASDDTCLDFCLCWANESWTGIWHGSPNKSLIEQTYPGQVDHIEHFKYFLKAFHDKRYVRIDNKPLLLIYRPFDIPQLESVIAMWNSMAIDNGLEGIYVVGVHLPVNINYKSYGIDAIVLPPRFHKRPWISKRRIFKWAKFKLQQILNKPTIYRIEDMMDNIVRTDSSIESFPCVLPNWDNTPRSGRNGVVLTGSTPDFFRKQLIKAKELLKLNNNKHKIIFIKSWNEWAEGNHLEPDLKYGKSYLEVIKQERQSI